MQTELVSISSELNFATQTGDSHNRFENAKRLFYWKNRCSQQFSLKLHDFIIFCLSLQVKIAIFHFFCVILIFFNLDPSVLDVLIYHLIITLSSRIKNGTSFNFQKWLLKFHKLKNGKAVGKSFSTTALDSLIVDSQGRLYNPIFKSLNYFFYQFSMLSETVEAVSSKRITSHQCAQPFNDRCLKIFN